MVIEKLECDPLAKNYISYSDTQRSIRAYEVKLFTKKSMYDWFKETNSTSLTNDSEPTTSASHW